VMDVYTDWREHNVQRSAQRNDIAMRYSVLTAFVFPNDVRGNRIAFQTFGSPGNALTGTFLDLDRPIFVDARVDPQGERPLRVYFVPRARLEGHLVHAKNNPVISPATNLPLTLPLRAGDNLEFAGYEVLNPNARPGFDLQILTYWRVLQRPPNLAVFVHLVDAQQRIVAQFDGLEALVHKLEPDDIIVQLHTLRLPNDLPASEYRLELGMYNRSNLQRVPLSSGTDYVLLMNIFDLQN